MAGPPVRVEPGSSSSDFPRTQRTQLTCCSKSGPRALERFTRRYRYAAAPSYPFLPLFRFRGHAHSSRPTILEPEKLKAGAAPSELLHTQDVHQELHEVQRPRKSQRKRTSSDQAKGQQPLAGKRNVPELHKAAAKGSGKRRAATDPASHPRL